MDSGDIVGIEAVEANGLLMAAVEAYDERAIRRLLEEEAHAWLGSPMSFSDDPKRNPALAAILHPLGSACAEAFDWFFSDVRHWRIGQWLPIHWAAAAKLPSAMKWCLAKSGARERGGGPLLELDKEPSSSLPSPRRSALGICAQTGDPEWLAQALEMGVAAGSPLSSIIAGDERGNVSAMGLALFEASQAAMDGDKERLAGFKACARLLFKKGFSPDVMLMPASRLISSAAWSAPEGVDCSKMAPLIRLAVDFANRRDKRGMGPMARAGAALDSRWASALALCGIVDGPEDSFGMAASAELRFQFFRDGSTAKYLGLGRKDPMGANAILSMRRSGVDDLAKLVADSLNISGTRPEFWPLRGQERDVLRELAAPSSKPKSCALRERVLLSLSTPEAGDAPTRAPFRI